MREAAGNSAASVASQLHAFVRDPAHWRPRFAHGKDALPDGAIVLRFAQGRFSRKLMRELPASARSELRDAANMFIRQVCFREAATHYQVLCVPCGAKHDAIKENYHLMMALIHPDRQDPALEHWPTDCAQRVNQAYAVLSDDALRQDYDLGLKKLEAGNPYAPQAPRRRGEPRRRSKTGRAGAWLAKALFAFTAVIATLLLLEVWLADPSDEYSMLQGAFSTRQDRDMLASADRPRFIGKDAGASLPPRPEVDTAAPRAQGFSLFRPLWRAFAGSDAEAPAVPPPVAHVPPVEPPRRVTPAPQVVAEVSRDSPVRKREIALAQTTAPPSAVSAPPTAPPSAVSAQDIEVLVARLVGYYEAGDTDKLMSLLDSGNAGFWQTARTRQAYLEFFRATRQRRLRVNNLAWHTAAQSAQAKGEATVFAEYFDEPGTLERRVDVEMDIAMRDGMAKITRLSLFPDAR